jgi:hypothetical protein
MEMPSAATDGLTAPAMASSFVAGPGMANCGQRARTARRVSVTRLTRPLSAC